MSENLKNSLLKGGATRILVIFLRKSFGFIRNIVFARFFLPDDIGLALLALTAAEIFSWFAGVGMSEYSIKEDNQAGINTAFSLSLVLSGTGFILLLSSAGVLSGMLSERDITLYIMAASYIIFSVPATFPINMLNKALMFEKAILPSLVNDIVAVASSLILLLLLHAGIWSIIFGQMAGFIASAAMYWYFSPVKISFQVDKQYVKGIFSYSWPLSLKSLSNLFIRKLEIITISKFSNSTNTAYFSYANNLIDNSYMLVTQLTGMTLPVLAKVKDNKEELKKWYGYSVKAASAIGFPTGMFFFVFSTPIIILLYGEKWISSAPLLAILGLGFAVRMALGESVGYLAYLHGKTKFILMTSVVNSVFKLTVGTFLVYKFGAMGGALYSAIVFNIIAVGTTMYMTYQEFQSYSSMLSAIPPVMATLPFVGLAYLMVSFNTVWITILAAIIFPVGILALLISIDKQFRTLAIELKIPFLSGYLK